MKFMNILIKAFIICATVLNVFGQARIGEECNGKRCHVNAYCVYSQCICKDGFKGNGVTCFEVVGNDQDEKSGKERTKHVIGSSNATDYNPTSGKYDFELPDINQFIDWPCHENSDCHDFASCINETCVCINGTVGDGIAYCVDTNYEADIEDDDFFCFHDHECADLESCVDHKCVCKYGTIGPQLKTCLEKPAQNKHSCTNDNYGHCHENASCVDGRCKCIDGYSGDGVNRCIYNDELQAFDTAPLNNVAEAQRQTAQEIQWEVTSTKKCFVITAPSTVADKQQATTTPGPPTTKDIITISTTTVVHPGINSTTEVIRKQTKNKTTFTASSTELPTTEIIATAPTNTTRQQTAKETTFPSTPPTPMITEIVATPSTAITRQRTTEETYPSTSPKPFITDTIENPTNTTTRLQTTEETRFPSASTQPITSKIVATSATSIRQQTAKIVENPSTWQQATEEKTFPSKPTQSITAEIAKTLTTTTSQRTTKETTFQSTPTRPITTGIVTNPITTVRQQATEETTFTSTSAQTITKGIDQTPTTTFRPQTVEETASTQPNTTEIVTIPSTTIRQHTMEEITFPLTSTTARIVETTTSTKTRQQTTDETSFTSLSKELPKTEIVATKPTTINRQQTAKETAFPSTLTQPITTEIVESRKITRKQTTKETIPSTEIVITPSTTAARQQTTEETTFLPTSADIVTTSTTTTARQQTMKETTIPPASTQPITTEIVKTQTNATTHQQTTGETLTSLTSTQPIPEEFNGTPAFATSRQQLTEETLAATSISPTTTEIVEITTTTVVWQQATETTWPATPTQPAIKCIVTTPAKIISQQQTTRKAMWSTTTAKSTGENVIGSETSIPGRVDIPPTNATILVSVEEGSATTIPTTRDSGKNVGTIPQFTQTTYEPGRAKCNTLNIVESNLQFLPTNRGTTGFSKQLCQQNTTNANTPLASCFCNRNGSWDKSTLAMTDCNQSLENLITNDTNVEEAAVFMELVTSNVAEITENNTIYAMNNIDKILEAGTVSYQTSSGLVGTVANLLESNFTENNDRLLHTLDNITSKTELNNGIPFQKTTKYVNVVALDRDLNKGVGQEVKKSNEPAFEFDQFRVFTDFENSTIDDSSIFLPPKIGGERVGFIAFRNPHNFIETKQNPDTRVNSIILSATTNGVDKNFDTDITLKFVLNTPYQTGQFDRDLQSTALCRYWDYGHWSYEGCSLDLDFTTNETVVCKCDHLTSFAALFDFSECPVQEFGLNVFTIVGCGLSAVCLFCTILMFIFVRALHEKSKFRSAFLLVNLALALLGLDITILVSEGMASYIDPLGAPCTAISCLTHFFLISAFAWMNCESFNIYLAVVMPMFSRGFVETKNLLKISVVWGWIMPAVYIAIVAGVDLNVYRRGKIECQDGTTHELATCWMHPGNVVYFVIIPAAILLSFNLYAYIAVSRAMSGGRCKSQDISNNKRRIKETWKTISLSMAIMTAVGLTWLLGFLVTVHIAFSYIFVILNTSQGVFLFALFVVRNKAARSFAKSEIVNMIETRSSNTRKK